MNFRFTKKGLAKLEKQDKDCKSVPLEWHQAREQQWEQFIKTCEKFDYIKIKSGQAIGYVAGKSPFSPQIGTQFIIPFEMVTMYQE